MVLGDLYKSEVYEMADYINSISPLIPKSTLTKAPSDELRYEQKDNDFLPDYSYLDPLLHALNEEEKGFEELAVAGYDRELLTKITSLRERSKIKLLQAPPLLNISSKPLVHESKYLL